MSRFGKKEFKGVFFREQFQLSNGVKRPDYNKSALMEPMGEYKF